MKRICIALLYLLLISVCSLMASPTYKSFIVNGETVSRWVNVSSFTEYDSNGNELHSKDHWGEVLYEYDTNGNMIYMNILADDISPSNHESWYENDAKGNMIHSIDSKGYECWYEYDAKGNIIYSKNARGVERWYEYDAEGNMIHYKDSDGDEKWYEYEFYPSGKVFKEIIYERF